MKKSKRQANPALLPVNLRDNPFIFPPNMAAEIQTPVEQPVAVPVPAPDSRRK